MKEIQYCLFTRHAEDVNFIKKKRDVRPKKIYLKTKTTTKTKPKTPKWNDKIIIEKMTTFSRCQHYWKIIYYTIYYYIFQKDYSIYHTKQTLVTHLFTCRKQIISIHVNYIKTFIHIYSMICLYFLKKSTDRSRQIITCFHNYKITRLRALL